MSKVEEFMNTMGVARSHPSRRKENPVTRPVTHERFVENISSPCPKCGAAMKKTGFNGGIYWTCSSEGHRHFYTGTRLSPSGVRLYEEKRL